jgi:hypothetical protein
MNYNLETLGDERFQQLCQAVLVCQHPDVQCLPVGQPDGGRDAFLRRGGRSKPSQSVVFQVKFVRDPGTREARDIIDQVIKTEKPKVERLIARGVSAYYLMTNVQGTSHFEVGSIDRADAELTAALSIDAYCWWRDDIERRIDAHANIKWSFPEILRATDLLQALMEGNLGSEQKRRADALRGYMVYQARYDAQLKFKQIDLQQNIIDLFVDVPAQVVPIHNGDPARWISRHISAAHRGRATDSFPFSSDQFVDSDNEPPVGALELLVNMTFSLTVPKVVVEGAPGQGKSTVTQYLCQLHRLLLLNRHADLSRAESQHKPREARIPFRIDIRDYASCIAGRNPFGNDPLERLPAGTNPLLESFIAAQVSRYTGIEFSVLDLKSVLRASHVLIVLDGFDEVADVIARNRIVSEVSDASARIGQDTLSTQIIITSRPTAFANSPGFPRDEWQHVQILALSAAAIQAYAGKWMDGRNADAREKKTVLSVLRDKLAQPHVRDLARNPMQLAILLTLISVQGASLPDKRTALYDKYIEIFLDREADKSAIVRDHRELLVQIHRYLAWVLHVDSEVESGPGHINESKLRDTVREFLWRSGHRTELVDQLFSGMVERVVVLVSRVQGTFEFEVQPLREYFAARYLYDTAPYSPPSSPRRGTLPERFEAIARNFYWLNVTRFYAGCYSSGELASVISAIEEIGMSEQFRYISNMSQLALMLISDYVFSQQPRLAGKLVSKFCEEPSLRILLGNRYMQANYASFTLPIDHARTTIIERCKALLAGKLESDTLSAVARVFTANCDRLEVKTFWVDVRPGYGDDTYWVKVGRALGIFERITEMECAAIEANQERITQEVVWAGRFDLLDAQPKRWQHVLNAILNGSNQFPIIVSRDQGAKSGRNVTLMTIISAIFSDLLSAAYGDGKDSSPLSRAMSRYMPLRVPEEQLLSLFADLKDDELIIPRIFIASLDEFLETKIDTLKSSLAPWSRLVEAARGIWGDRWAIYKLAVVAASNVKSSDRKGGPFSDAMSPLCDRAAQVRSDVRSLKGYTSLVESVSEGETASVQQTLLYMLFSWSAPRKLIELSDQLGEAINRLPESHWLKLATALSGRQRLRRRARRRDRSTEEKINDSGWPGVMSERLACALLLLSNESLARRIYDKYLVDYRGRDRAVLRAILEIAVDLSSEEPQRWAAALPVVAHAYANGVSFPRHYFSQKHLEFIEPVQGIPYAEARQICAEAGLYPLALVGQAEATLAATTGSEAIPVGKVAVRDEWFAAEIP